jgi:SAM-dependent methyltransferase
LSSHLYSDSVRRAAWAVRRFGVRALVMKRFRMALAPVIIRRLEPHPFEVAGARYDTFHHRYNTTWANERAVEIPLVKALIDDPPGANILEVGNVLSHYFEPTWQVLDKYEKGPRVVNEDVVDFKGSSAFDLIVSISTFEHIGFDDQEAAHGSSGAILAAWESVKDALRPGGLAAITAPMGYNPDMDELVNANAFAFDETHFLKRKTQRSWECVTPADARGSLYGKPFPAGNCIVFGLYRRPAG